MYVLSLDVLVGEDSHSDALPEQQRALNIQHYWFDYNGCFMESFRAVCWPSLVPSIKIREGDSWTKYEPAV